MQPNLFLIGAHKAATTALAEALGQAPNICLSNPKEPSYFSWDHRWRQPWSSYEYHFRHCPKTSYFLDASTTYSQTGFFPEVPERIWHYTDSPRFIYMVRHPLKRIESAWIQYRAQGRSDVNEDFGKAVLEHPQLVEASLYYKQLLAYHKYFNLDDFLILSFEEFASNPTSHLRRIYDFLGIPRSAPESEAIPVLNKSSGKTQSRRLRRPVRTMAEFLPEKMSVGIKGSRAVRRLDQAFLRLPVPYPRWDSECLSRTLPIIEDDAHYLLQYMRWPGDTWDFDRYRWLIE